MRRLVSIMAGAFLSVGAATCFAAGSPAKDGGAEWGAHGRDAAEQRFSPLTQVNADNVGQLGLAWYTNLAERGGYQSTPLVIDGRLYITTPWSKVYAFDAKTGKALWKYDPNVPREIAGSSLCCNISNRGVAYWNGKIIWGTLDGRLVAVNAKNGRKVWESQVTDPTMAYSITGAPRIGNGIVFIGEGGGEFYTRGFLAAHDADTGKALWRFWTVPGNPAKGPDHAASDSVMPMAAQTWTGEWWKMGGGGTVWDGILYDPETSTVMFGTGNGIPWPSSLRSPDGGDNLFIASIVALDAKTGKYKWHYQTTPMEGFDFDSTSPLTVADINVNGQKKHVVMQAPKNGVMYVIEVATGKVVSADPFVPSINWATGFDEKNNWKPILNPDANYGKTGKGFYVVPGRAHAWSSQSYNPATGLLYIPASYGVGSYVAEKGSRILGNQLVDVSLSKQPDASIQRPVLKDTGSYLLAWDPVKRKVAWTQRQASGSAGTLTTAGNLVFQGVSGQKLAAMRADTGEIIWSTPTQGNVVPGPISYSIDGVQYLAVISSASTGFAAANGTNHLLVYRLGGKVTLPPAPPVVAQVLNPPDNFGDDAQRKHGQDVYERSCTGCHEGGRMFTGYPDLNYTIALNNGALFKSIVLDGALRENGMMPFKKSLTEEDVESIRSYLTFRANDLKKNPPRPPAGRGAPPPPPAPAPAAHQ
ncbi:MAG: PQQ-dependent dehydrogenase, methanol/ethanol family [Steroidobacteraceae bacterium]